MEIVKTQNSDALVVALVGRLDTSTAPQLEAELADVYATAPALSFDFSGLDYISSAGLRVLLISQKEMNKLGKKMVLKNVNDTVAEVLEITGFNDILTVE